MQAGFSRRLGSLQSFQKTEDGLVAKTGEGCIRIKTFSPSVVQVTLSPTAIVDEFSYAVTAKPLATPWSLEELADRLVVKSERFELTLLKKNTILIFKNAHGVVLNEDDPGLGTSWIGEQVTTYKRLKPDERFVGLGEKTGPLDRKGTGYQNWNSDAYAYHSGSDPLYCSMPFYIGLHTNVQYGIFLDNSHKTFFNFGASNNRFSSFSADAGEMNYFLIQGESVAEIVKHYTWLTGRIQLPPKWSIGYQQCRYSYYPDKEVLSVANTFREKEIPADAIVLDIHYMDKYKIFSWDAKNFSNPKSLID